MQSSDSKDTIIHTTQNHSPYAGKHSTKGKTCLYALNYRQSINMYYFCTYICQPRNAYKWYKRRIVNIMKNTF